MVIGATGFVGSHVVARLISEGYHVKCTTRDKDNACWLKDVICNNSSNKYDSKKISIHKLQLGTDGPLDVSVLDSLMENVELVFFCAGFEIQSEKTISFMVNNAIAIIKSARRQKVDVVVLTSSGGSTNPIGLHNSTPKNEILHWSDPDQQKKMGKYSPAAKTLMELNSLKEVGRNKSNEIINKELSSISPRLVIVNPNLILGPQLKPGKISGNSLPWIVKILKKEAMSTIIPNDSMSIIDVRDLADIHVKAAQKECASGRYFGVNQSYTWEEILSTLEQVYPPYNKPPRFEGEAKLPTQFDHSRKKSLGVSLRPLTETLKDLILFLQETDSL